jgi:hypothetical protein
MQRQVWRGLSCAVALWAGMAIAEPTRVHVGVYAYSISELNVSQGTFLFDGYIWFRWEGDALPADAFDFSVVNGSVESVDSAPAVTQGSVHRSSRRVRLRLRGDFQLDDYPFDRQVLPLQLEHRWMGAEQLVFVPDEGAVPAGTPLRNAFLARELEVGDWIIQLANHRVETKQYETDFGSIQKGVWNGQSSRYTFEVHLKRRLAPYVLKVLLPLLLIVAMAFTAFFIDAREFSTQIAIVITALLSCVAFHVSQSSSLPQVGYLVKADLFFLLSYAFVFFALASVVLGNRWTHSGRPERGPWLYARLRVALPLLFLGGLGTIVAVGA